MKSNYQSLVERLEPNLSVRSKDDISTSMVHILQREQLARRFLCDIVISEIPKHGEKLISGLSNTVTDC